MPNRPNDDRELWEAALKGGGPVTARPDDVLIASWLDGRLAAECDERTLVESWLASSAEGREEVREMRAAMSETASLDFAPESIRAAARTLVRRRTAATVGMTVGTTQTTKWARAVGWSLSAAASIAVCLVAFRAGQSATPARAAASVDFFDAVTFGAIDDEDDELVSQFFAASGSDDSVAETDAGQGATGVIR